MLHRESFAPQYVFVDTVTIVSFILGLMLLAEALKGSNRPQRAWLLPISVAFVLCPYQRFVIALIYFFGFDLRALLPIKPTLLETIGYVAAIVGVFRLWKLLRKPLLPSSQASEALEPSGPNVWPPPPTSRTERHPEA